MLRCSQPSQMPAGLRPGWISAATRLVGPHPEMEARVRASNPISRGQIFRISERGHGAARSFATRMKIDPLPVEFTDEQKRYLEGFATGLQISRVGRGFGGGASVKSNSEPVGPDAAHHKARDKVLASGKKLADQETFKREEHPFDAYPRLKQQALTDSPPSPADNFRWRYYGLFYVAPAQDSYMCRLRIPNGVLKHWQFLGVADLAERFCGP